MYFSPANKPLIIIMEYDLFNSWEDKMQMLTATNSIIDELGLANKISKVKVQSAAMENINKVNILRDMWNSYRGPLLTTQSARDLFSSHMVWKTNLQRRMKAEAKACGVTDFDAELVAGTRYTKSHNCINPSGVKTFFTDPYSLSSIYLVEFTSPVELKNHTNSLISKGHVSSNINIFMTCQKVLFFGIEHGLSKRQVGNFLLQIMEKETPSFVSLVKGSILTPAQVFNCVLDCVRSNSDIQAVKSKMALITRNVGTPITQVMNGLEKLTDEYLSLKYPFEGAEKKKKRGERHLMDALKTFIEPATQEQLELLKTDRDNTGKKTDLEVCLRFVSQLESLPEYKLQTAKSGYGKSMGLASMNNAFSKGNEIFANPSLELRDTLGSTQTKPKSKEGKKKGKQQKGGSQQGSPPSNQIDSSTGAKPKKKKDKGKKTANANVVKDDNKASTQSKPNSSPATGGNKTPIACKFCATCCGNDNKGPCKYFPKDMAPTSTPCGLCGSGLHIPGRVCGQLFNLKAKSKN